MQLVKDANLVVRFLLELGALAALGGWGYRIGGRPLAGVGLAAGIPLVIAIVWGTFVAPNASVPVPGAVRLSSSSPSSGRPPRRSRGSGTGYRRACSASSRLPTPP